MSGNSEAFLALAGLLQADEALQSAAQALLTSYLSSHTDVKYAFHCAFLVSSRLPPAKSPISLKQMWASLSEVHVKEFCTTLQAFQALQSSGEVSIFLTLPAELTFDCTFYMKFEEIWESWVGGSLLYKRLAWLVFVNLRVKFACLRDVSRTALVLVGVLKTVLKHLPSLSTPTHLSLIGTLLSQSLRTVSPIELVNQAAESANEMTKCEGNSASLEALIAELERTYKATLGPDSVDERMFLSPGKFVGLQRNIASMGGPCPTPISQNLEVYYWLSECRQTSEMMLVSSLENLQNKDEIESRISRFRADLSHNSELKRLSSDIIHLYLSLLAQAWDQRRRLGSESDFLESYNHDSFQRSLLALAIECKLYSENSDLVPFEEVLQVSGVTPFDLWKLLVNVQPHFPRSLRAHFRLIEIKIECSLGWERSGVINMFLESLDQDSLSDDSEEQLPVPTPAVNKFFERVSSYFVRRIRDLAAYLQLEDQARESVWTAVKFLMSEQTEVVVGRHLDQIILCALYDCCLHTSKVTWGEIKDAYEQANPEEVSIVCRAVKATSSVLSIEDFHARVIKPRLAEMRRNDPCPPRIPALSPTGSFPSLPQASPCPLPLKSPFRHYQLSPASQRLYSDPSTRPSDRRLDLDQLEREFSSSSPAFLAPLLTKPEGLHLPKLGPAP